MGKFRSFIAWLKREHVADFRRPLDSPRHKNNAHMRWVRK